ncbi:uncharacterized protein C8A04DRAFT_13999 [Dichotomopilus funicola]|uniref:Mid2 domain-containing protein n=1 Tax=Dichotomopilus funicola TaxID=1934379 RepID=A0AAN6UYS9_9PEZI|nr:hypothetical protein C8A04DRAFT_13999 [Dichotomopilus funicola]
MVKFGIVAALGWAAGLVVASPADIVPVLDVRTRNMPGKSDEDTRNLIWRDIVAAANYRRENTFSNSMSMDKSWVDATLFSYTYEANTTGTKLDNVEASLSIEVKCVTCYFKAGATATLTINGDFDLGNTLGNLTDQLGEEFHNMSQSARDSFKEVFDWDEFQALWTPEDFELDEFVNFDNFHIDTDFDIELPPLPEVQLLFQIDNMDLYMEMDTTIAAGATLTIPLYKSQTVVGISIAPGLEAGLFATMDLILGVEGELVIRSGFHLLIEEPVGFNIALFGQNVSSIIFVAEFLTNITFGAELEEEENCALQVVQEYTLAVGASAGATLAIGSHTWGPQPNTSIPIYYTTMANVCAITADAITTPPTPSPTNRLAARQDGKELETTTLTKTVIYTNIGCAEPRPQGGCPQSLQATTLTTTVKTHVTAIPPGATATFPESTALTVASTIPFGKNINKVAATTGTPKSYVPPPPPKPKSTGTAKHDGDGNGVLDGVGDVWKGETGGVSNKLIIGLSVGLGVPLLCAVIASLIHWIRRRTYAKLPKFETAVEYTGSYRSPMEAERESMMLKKMPEVTVSHTSP